MDKGGGPIMNPETDRTVSTRRLLIFRILAVLIGLLFVVAGVMNARAGWMLVVGTSGDLHPEVNRWFTAVAGTADLIGAGCFLMLAWRPQLYLLFGYTVVSVVVAAAVNLPFVPEFAVLVAAVVIVLIAYPYWRELRDFRTWWREPHVVMLSITAVAAIVLFVFAGIDVARQIGGTDAAAQANWWADYAEHASLIGIAGVVASSGRPGWRVLGGLAAAAWLYLGFVAVFSLPDHTASWGVAGGLAALAVGAFLMVTCIRGDRPTRAAATGGIQFAGG
jgi:hypothetical protein